MEERVRIIIEVMGGVVPGRPLPEFTKRFAITSDMWYGEGKWQDKAKEGQQEILKTYGYAQEYARSLMDPKNLNWVKMEWIYL